MVELTQLMHEALPEGGVWLPDQKPHMEVMDEDTGNVWMTVDGVTQQQFADFKLEENWRKVGRAAGAMDQALFCHSPNASDGPLQEQIINGLRFINVAQPSTPSQSACGLIELMVNKAHVLGFDTGRQLSILQFDGKHYVEVVGDDQNDSALPLSGGASIQKITLSQPWVVPLPTPTQTLWVFKPELRSFQGPVELPTTN
jgi:hypothetical protein